MAQWPRSTRASSTQSIDVIRPKCYEPYGSHRIHMTLWGSSAQRRIFVRSRWITSKSRSIRWHNRCCQEAWGFKVEEEDLCSDAAKGRAITVAVSSVALMNGWPFLRWWRPFCLSRLTDDWCMLVPILLCHSSCLCLQFLLLLKLWMQQYTMAIWKWSRRCQQWISSGTHNAGN